MTEDGKYLGRFGQPQVFPCSVKVVSDPPAVHLSSLDVFKRERAIVN